MADVELRGVSKAYRDASGGRTDAVRDFTLRVGAGEYVVLVGPSGAGKTTVLRLVAGLEAPDAGEVRLGGRSVSTIAPADRGVGLVFQDHPLFPQLNVRENLGFGLRRRRLPAAEVARRVGSLAGRLGLEGVLGRRPETLSGGERQRVALGAVLVGEPRVLLLDEPLAQLDAPLRLQLRAEIRHWQRELGLTTIHVTHDQAEAMAVADRLAVMRRGVLEQAGPPLDLYRAPAVPFVAEFLGQPGMNLVPGTIERAVDREAWRFTPTGGSMVSVANASFAVAPSDVAGRGWIGIRPETLDLMLAEEGAGSAAGAWEGRVEHVERFGPETWVRIKVWGGVILVVRVWGECRVERGSAVRPNVRAGAMLWFADRSG